MGVWILVWVCGWMCGVFVCEHVRVWGEGEFVCVYNVGVGVGRVEVCGSLPHLATFYTTNPCKIFTNQFLGSKKNGMHSLG